eukprot:symbB.v1.2.037438.t1/scaffold5434.1/size28417/1
MVGGMLMHRSARQHALLLAGAAVFAGATWSLLHWWKQYRASYRRHALADLFSQVKMINKGIAMVVSDAKSASFSSRNLSKYLLQRGLCPSNDLLRDAQLLLSLLEDEATEKTSGGRRVFSHALKSAVIKPKRLQNLFPEIKNCYVQQPLDYGRNSRYGDDWRISCYLVVMENWKPKIMPHEPMLRCLGDVMNECVRSFETWYCSLKGFKPGSKPFSVMNAFVTRYRPLHGEDELKKHIDGANVDGSCILALPTDEPFEGGALHVWDGKPKQELVYKMSPGDCMFMDTKIWHQAKPITSGCRWALVLFLKSDRAAKIELWALVSSSFVWACGQWIVAPALPYFAMAKGCTAFHYAMISSAYAASQMISSPILGMLSERIGRRPILLGGLAATSIVYLLMAKVTTVFQLLLSRATLGFLSGAAAVEVAFVADLTSKTDRVDWVNMQTRLQSAGCLLGPAIGGMVAPYSRHYNDASTRFEFEHLCYAISILVMLNFVIGIRFFTCPPTYNKVVLSRTTTPTDRPKRFMSSYFLKISTMILLLVCFLDAFSLAVSDGPEAYFLHDKFGFAAAQQATFMMTCSASSLIWGSVAPYVISLCPANVVCMLFSLFSAAAM